MKRERIYRKRVTSCADSTIEYSAEEKCRKALMRLEDNIQQCKEILDRVERKQYAREHKVVQIGNVTVYLNQNGMVEVTILGKVMELTVTEYKERYISAFCK